MSEGLRLERVRLSQGARALLEIDAAVAPGSVTTLMGPSGSGKSTLLSFVMGDLAPGFEALGHVTLDGRDLTALAPEARRIGILYQDPLLFPHLDVAANLAFGLPPGGARATRRAAVHEALSEIALDDYGPRDPATLSGGQAARVALMRVLLSAPRALLLDEPFSKLDAGLRDQMRRLVFDRARASGVPVLMVTHDEADAEAAGGPVIRLCPLAPTPPAGLVEADPGQRPEVRERRCRVRDRVGGDEMLLKARGDGGLYFLDAPHQPLDPVAQRPVAKRHARAVSRRVAGAADLVERRVRDHPQHHRVLR